VKQGGRRHTGAVRRLSELNQLNQIGSKLLAADGWSVKLWHFEPTHMTLVLRLVPYGEGRGTHLECLGVKHISGPTLWNHAKLRVQLQGEDIKIEDEVGFTVCCRQVYLKLGVGVFDQPL